MLEFTRDNNAQPHIGHCMRCFIYLIGQNFGGQNCRKSDLLPQIFVRRKFCPITAHRAYTCTNVRERRERQSEQSEARGCAILWILAGWYPHR